MPTLAAITLYYTQMHWPSKILSEKIDGKGAYFGCKSTTLESVGMILPMIMFPDLGRNVIFMIDNLAVMFGWYNGYVKMTSQLWKYWQQFSIRQEFWE